MKPNTSIYLNNEFDHYIKTITFKDLLIYNEKSIFEKYEHYYKTIYEYKNLRFEDYTFILKNKFTIYTHNETDIRYETLSKLNRLQEIKVSLLKSLFFCKSTNYHLIAILIGILYLILRIIRLLISDRKIIF